jgi:hypothetical protein
MQAKKQVALKRREFKRTKEHQRISVENWRKICVQPSVLVSKVQNSYFRKIFQKLSDQQNKYLKGIFLHPMYLEKLVYGGSFFVHQ